MSHSRKKYLIITLIVVIIAFTIVVGINIHKNSLYKEAISLGEAGNYPEAAEILGGLGNYKDSQDLADMYTQANTREKQTSRIIDAYEKYQSYVKAMKFDELERKLSVWLPDDSISSQKDAYRQNTNLNDLQIGNVRACIDLARAISDLLVEEKKNRPEYSWDFCGTSQDSLNTVYGKELQLFRVFPDDPIVKKMKIELMNNKHLVGAVYKKEDNTGFEGDIGIAQTGLAFQRKDESKELTADNIKIGRVVDISTFRLGDFLQHISLALVTLNREVKYIIIIIMAMG